MTNNKKEQERAALHTTIWRIANDLRGSVDGWDFKQYVLGMLFYRFISENLASYINDKQHEAGQKNFNYISLKDKEAERGRDLILEEKGFFIHPSELFENVRKKAANDTNLNETLEKVFHNIEASAKGTDSESDMKGLFDDIDVNSNKLGATVPKRNELLVKLMNAIGDLNLGNYGDNTIDVFGDAYEYLMTMYAANAGKSGGEFFTPQEVSELLTRIAVVGKKEVRQPLFRSPGSTGTFPAINTPELTEASAWVSSGVCGPILRARAAWRRRRLPQRLSLQGSRHGLPAIRQARR